MFLRLLFLLLLALNVGAGAWLLFGPKPATPLPPLTDPGVPELVPVSPDTSAAPTPGSAAASIGAAGAATAAAAATIPAAAATTVGAPVDAGTAGDVCASIGPFMTRVDMRAALHALAPHVARIRYRQVEVNRTHGFRVFLPAVATRAAALDETRSLAAKGVRDYYVVTTGDTENTVSLGLFDREVNARARAAQVRALGFPAEVKPRIEARPAYRIDYAVPPDAGFEWRSLVPERGDLEATTIDCF